MCGEWFYIMPGEEIAIFSAEHDKFMVLDYDKVKDYDMRESAGVVNGSPAPILIFRPFQTARCCFLLLFHIMFLHALTQPCQFLHPTQWTMASCILLKAGSELGNTFRKYLSQYECFIAHIFLYWLVNLWPLFLRIQMDTTTCSCKTTPSARSWSGTTR